MSPEPETERKNNRVAQVMHRGVVTCAEETPIPQVAQLLTRHDISALPVVDAEGFLVGIITRSDLVTLRAHEDYWRAMKAEHAMVRQVTTITPDDTLAEASKRMSDQKIHRLIVIEQNENGRAKPIGVISQTDIVRDMALE